MFDIVFSILAHESLDCVIDLCRNIHKYVSPTNSYLIVISANEVIMQEKKRQKECSGSSEDPWTHVQFNPHVFTKRYASIDIMDGLLDNINYLQSMGIHYQGIMSIASNCMFIKYLPPVAEILDNLEEPPVKFLADEVNINSWHWHVYFRNSNLVAFLKEHNYYFIGFQCEGLFYTEAQAIAVRDYIEGTLKPLITVENCIFEEFILPTTEYILFGKIGKRFCKVYWEKPNYTPSPWDVVQLKRGTTRDYCVKRIPRDPDNTLRKFINQLD